MNKKRARPEPLDWDWMKVDSSHFVYLYRGRWYSERPRGVGIDEVMVLPYTRRMLQRRAARGGDIPAWISI